MPATIRDVARRASVSVATVSRVINDSPLVSDGTRRKVLDVITELDYTPNPNAQRLSLGRTLTIGVILPFLTLPSFVERLRGVQNALADSGYDLILYSVESPQNIESYLRKLSRRDRIDGAIIISLHLSDDYVERFHGSNIPAILLDAVHPRMSRVIMDDVAGGYKATRHLIGLGHRRIAFLSDYLENAFKFVAMRYRYHGYRQALAEAGIPFVPEYHRQGELGGREAFQKAKDLLSLEHAPTAVFAASDTHAIGVLKAAHELGIQVPEQLSVIGYDGIRDAEYLDLTTIQQPLFDSGVESANILLASLVEPPESPLEVVLPTQLIIRGTTAPPPG
jgi:DNA-binding LacI/PurR family transcriptional regulator